MQGETTRMASAPNSGDILRVLLLQDDPSDAAILARHLDGLGRTVQCDAARTWHDFVHRAGTDSYHIVVCSYTFGGKTVLDACKRLRAMGRSTPLLLVTDPLDEGNLRQCLAAGIFDYVLKQDMLRLPFAVHRAIDGRAGAAGLAQPDFPTAELQQDYRLLFEANPNPMWVYDTETLRFLAVNGAAVERYGYSSEEFASITLKEIRPEEDIPRFLHEYTRESTTRAFDFGFWRHRTKAGQILDVEIYSRPLQFGGRPARLVLALDVTARLRAEIALRESEARHRSIIEGAPYGILQADDECRLRMANPALADMLGYGSVEELLRMGSVSKLFVDPLSCREGLKEIETTGRLSTEAAWRRRDGKTAYVRLLGHALRDPATGDEMHQMFVEDITEKRLLEMAVLQAQKMEAIGRLVGGVAHDFNNLLTIIGSGVGMMRESRGDWDRVEKHARQIETAAERATLLVRQLMTFARRQAVQPVALDLNATVQELSKVLPFLLGPNVELVLDLAPGLDTISADLAQIERVIMNLVVNARDAMPDGGRLAIQTANVPVSERDAPNYGEGITPGHYAMLAVRDSGIGMDVATQARAFEPFFTTKEVGKGTGLGLATVYGIVKQAGGFVWMYSELGKGSTFKIFLPRAAEAAEAAPPAAAPEPVPCGSETILLVEDEETLREIAADYLQAKGYTVLTAAGGEEALGICRSHPDSIRALVTDVIMPGMAGPDLARAVATVRPDIAVIFVSGYSERDLRGESLGVPSAFLQKPFSLELLARCLRSLLD
jgi:two-component system, cell cycle sensor histidine kinase and response regulator CckA